MSETLEHLDDAIARINGDHAQEHGMTDTTRANLRERLGTRIERYCWTATDTTNPVVDDVLAMFREAMLSERAVEAGAFGIAFVGIEPLYPHQDETWRATDERAKEFFRREARSGIIAALDAITTGGDDELA